MSDSSDNDELCGSDEENDSEESEYEECDPVPKPIKSLDEFTDIAFHPQSSTTLAAGDISGCVKM